ncbi:unnamed protein product [Arctogadus glacialis]
MSLRATSHGDFQTLSGSAGKSPSLEDRMYKSMSMSSSNVTGGSRFGSGELEEVKGTARFGRRPVRAVRPLSALGTSGSFLQINHLQGELVRKRKECEDLKKENKYLSNEIHMERIMMRTENELTMRNLRNLNQELLAQVKELKQTLHLSQQRATLCSRAAQQAEASQGECGAEPRPGGGQGCDEPAGQGAVPDGPRPARPGAAAAQEGEQEIQ